MKTTWAVLIGSYITIMVCTYIVGIAAFISALAMGLFLTASMVFIEHYKKGKNDSKRNI